MNSVNDRNSRYTASNTAERRIKQSANPFADALRKLFRGPAHPASERQDSKGGGNENEKMSLGSEEFLPNRDWNQQQEPVHDDGWSRTCEGLRSFQSTHSTGWLSR